MKTRAMTAALATSLAFAVAEPGAAQVVGDCGWAGSVANIPEPWDRFSRTYANGAIRVAQIDTGGEPVCCPQHLLVLSPSGDGRDEPAFRQCRLVSAGDGWGFYEVDVTAIAASYDPARGLLLSVPVAHWHGGMETGAPPIRERIEVRINQATGVVSLE